MGRSARASLLLSVVFAALAAASCTDPARERFDRAEKAFLEHRMEDALSGYRSIPTGFPQSRYAPPALLRQGDLYGTYFRNFEAALDAYGSLLFNYPRSQEAPRAAMSRAEILLLHFFDFASAAGDLELLRKRYPGFRRMDEAMLLLAKAYAGLQDTARQERILSELVARFPDSPRAMEARWMAAYGFLGRGMYAQARREFRKILLLAGDPEDAARARWGMAQAMEGEEDFEGAIAQYEAIRGVWKDPGYVERKIALLSDRAAGKAVDGGETDLPEEKRHGEE